MTVVDKPSARETKRLQTRERLMGAAIAEFKRAGMADADVGAIVTAAGVAHGTFFFHFPTKEHVLLELEQREEQRIAKQLARSTGAKHDLARHARRGRPSCDGTRTTTRRRVVQRLPRTAFFADTASSDESRQHPVIVEVAQEIEQAQKRGDVDPDVTPMNSAVFFLLGLYALLTTTHDWPGQNAMIEDYVARTLRSIAPK